MRAVSLPPELESYAADVIAEGRYRDCEEVVSAGVALLRDRDTARAAFAKSVFAAEAEAEQQGCVSAEWMVSRAQGRLAGRHDPDV